ncbi:hypothetical protein BJ508DRAFT_332153 [Ascobolus immersus RN42]|uniref:Uncharacterized protein n=1 Tax=Ascobolus immersus RN42 TaxID=1160509 RepID=A0A3N4HQT5_ASCIM|nr:hypothetical protein BJ508DRAFT_332153 [Ascobolus immersus RN42]
MSQLSPMPSQADQTATDSDDPFASFNDLTKDVKSASILMAQLELESEEAENGETDGPLSEAESDRRIKGAMESILRQRKMDAKATKFKGAYGQKEGVVEVTLTENEERELQDELEREWAGMEEYVERRKRQS